LALLSTATRATQTSDGEANGEIEKISATRDAAAWLGQAFSLAHYSHWSSH
jgi:hypothetical protein